MKKILRWMYGLLGLGICAAIVVLLFNMGLIGGFSASLPDIEYVQGLPVGEEIPCGKKTSAEFELIAQEGGLSLYFRAEDANFCVETASGKRWYAFPPEGADDWARGVFKTEMVSSLIINYIDLENKENVKKNSQAASVKKDTFTVRKIENGFRTDYYFKDGAVTIPVEVFLKDGHLETRILTGEIVEENPERFILSSVRLLPYFGCAAESDEGYVFVPDGQGALMHVNNGKGNMQEYRAAVYGENASVTRMFSAADAFAASLPVFGIKRNDAAFLAVITAGENAAYINAMPAFRDTSYTNAWAEYKLRYTDSYMLDASSNLGQTITLYQDDAIEVATCQQRYYFLEGEAADYNGMADCYRSYLLAECGVTEQPADDTVLFVDFAAAVTRKESLLGVPINRQRRLSALAEIQTMYEGLRTELTGGIRLRIGEQAGMMYQSVHAPYHHVDELWHENAHTRQAVEELVNCVRATADAEVPIMVCHAFIGFDKHHPTPEGLRNFEPIIREAERLGVKVALENTEGEEYLAALMQHFAGSPAVGFCWDTGHEMCYNHSQDMLALYGDRLLCTHLNDNLGIKDYNGQITWRDDLHLLPFDGIADWQGIAHRLNQHHFDGPLTFELTTLSKPDRHENDLYAGMDFRVYLAMAYQRACRVAALKLRDKE